MSASKLQRYDLPELIGPITESGINLVFEGKELRKLIASGVTANSPFFSSSVMN